MVLYAGNVTTRILITCPHCKLASRYDASIVEDAIRDDKQLVCVACEESFGIGVTVPAPRSPTLRAADQSAIELLRRVYAAWAREDDEAIDALALEMNAVLKTAAGG